MLHLYATRGSHLGRKIPEVIVDNRVGPDNGTRPQEYGRPWIRRRQGQYQELVAFNQHLRKERDPIGSELRWTAEAAPLAFAPPIAPCCYASGSARARIRRCREHRQHHATSCRLSVRPGRGQRAQARAGLFQLLGDVEQVTGGACQPVEPRYHHHRVFVAQLPFEYSSRPTPHLSNGGAAKGFETGLKLTGIITRR